MSRQGRRTPISSRPPTARQLSDAIGAKISSRTYHKRQLARDVLVEPLASMPRLVCLLLLGLIAAASAQRYCLRFWVGCRQHLCFGPNPQSQRALTSTETFSPSSQTRLAASVTRKYRLPPPSRLVHARRSLVRLPTSLAATTSTSRALVWASLSTLPAIRPAPSAIRSDIR